MKGLICFFLVVLAFDASATLYPYTDIHNNEDTNHQRNDAVVSSTSSQSNVQINNNNDSFIRMGDIHCPVPSVSASATGGAEFDPIVGAAFTYPLGISACKRAAESAASQRLHVAIVEQNKRDILFEHKMAVVCLELHEIAQLSTGSKLFEECEKVRPINREHLHNNLEQEGINYSRVSNHPVMDNNSSAVKVLEVDVGSFVRKLDL